MKRAKSERQPFPQSIQFTGSKKKEAKAKAADTSLP
jgi:hypothetical protein